MKGTIILKDYEVVACHGVNPEEKVNPQRFLFTVKVDTDLALSASSDNLANTVSYSAVKKVVKAVAEENSFDLIETLAYFVAKRVLLAFPLADDVSVKVKKPDAPMSGNFDFVGVELPLKWHDVYLALGSNEGDRNAYLDLAIKLLNEDDNFKEVVESKRIETEAYGGVATGEFVNSCVKLKTLYSPHELLAKIDEIEKAGDRVRTVHWGDRTLDVDIIFFDEEVIGDDYLVVPHPDMQNREFVLKPLLELCPNKVHPLLKKRVNELYFELTTKQL